MNATVFFNVQSKKDEWSTKWSEHISPYTFCPYICEPVNALTSLTMMCYVLYNASKYRHQQKNLLFYVMHYGIAFNLLSSFLAHATYDSICILIDEYSILLLLSIFAICKTKSIRPTIYTLILFTYNDNLAYAISIFDGIGYILDDIEMSPKNIQYNIYFAIRSCLCFFAIWLLDQYIHSLWYLYGHALFHIGFTYNIVQLVTYIY